MSSTRPILVVDDDRDSRSMAKMILESRGYEVELCSSGLEAIERLKTLEPAVVILDIMMPGMSGYDVLVYMRQRPETQNIPVIMVTAKGNPEDMIAGYQYGANYYIPKPFTTEQLLWGVKLYT